MALGLGRAWIPRRAVAALDSTSDLQTSQFSCGIFSHMDIFFAYLHWGFRKTFCSKKVEMWGHSFHVARRAIQPCDSAWSQPPRAVGGRPCDSAWSSPLELWGETLWLSLEQPPRAVGGNQLVACSLKSVLLAVTSGPSPKGVAWFSYALHHSSLLDRAMSRADLTACYPSSAKPFPIDLCSMAL